SCDADTESVRRFCAYYAADPAELPSCPTRRSSDLAVSGQRCCHLKTGPSIWGGSNAWRLVRYALSLTLVAKWCTDSPGMSRGAWTSRGTASKQRLLYRPDDWAGFRLTYTSQP